MRLASAPEVISDLGKLVPTLDKTSGKAIYEAEKAIKTAQISAQNIPYQLALAKIESIIETGKMADSTRGFLKKGVEIAKNFYEKKEFGYGDFVVYAMAFYVQNLNLPKDHEVRKFIEEVVNLAGEGRIGEVEKMFNENASTVSLIYFTTMINNGFASINQLKKDKISTSNLEKILNNAKNYVDKNDFDAAAKELEKFYKELNRLGTNLKNFSKEFLSQSLSKLEQTISIIDNFENNFNQLPQKYKGEIYYEALIKGLNKYRNEAETLKKEAEDLKSRIATGKASEKEISDFFNKLSDFEKRKEEFFAKYNKISYIFALIEKSKQSATAIGMSPEINQQIKNSAITMNNSYTDKLINCLNNLIVNDSEGAEKAFEAAINAKTDMLSILLSGVSGRSTEEIKPMLEFYREGERAIFNNIARKGINTAYIENIQLTLGIVEDSIISASKSKIGYLLGGGIGGTKEAHGIINNSSRVVEHYAAKLRGEKGTIANLDKLTALQVSIAKGEEALREKVEKLNKIVGAGEFLISLVHPTLTFAYIMQMQAKEQHMEDLTKEYGLRVPEKTTWEKIETAAFIFTAFLGVARLGVIGTASRLEKMLASAEMVSGGVIFAGFGQQIYQLYKEGKTDAVGELILMQAGAIFLSALIHGTAKNIIERRTGFKVEEPIKPKVKGPIKPEISGTRPSLSELAPGEIGGVEIKRVVPKKEGAEPTKAKTGPKGPEEIGPIKSEVKEKPVRPEIKATEEKPGYVAEEKPPAGKVEVEDPAKPIVSRLEKVFRELGFPEVEIKGLVDKARKRLVYKNNYELYKFLNNEFKEGSKYPSGIKLNELTNSNFTVIVVDKSKMWWWNNLRKKYGDLALIIYFEAASNLEKKFGIPALRFTESGDELVIIFSNNKKYPINPTEYTKALTEEMIRIARDEYKVPREFLNAMTSVGEVTIPITAVIDPKTGKVQIKAIINGKEEVFDSLDSAISFAEGIENTSKAEEALNKDFKKLKTLLSWARETKIEKPLASIEENDAKGFITLRIGLKGSTKREFVLFSEVVKKGTPAIKAGVAGASAFNLLGHPLNDLLLEIFARIFEKNLQKEGITGVEIYRGKNAPSLLCLKNAEVLKDPRLSKVLEESEKEMIKMLKAKGIDVEQVRFYTGNNNDEIKLNVAKDICGFKFSSMDDYNRFGSIVSMLHFDPESIINDLKGFVSPNTLSLLKEPLPKWARGPEDLIYYLKSKGVLDPDIVRISGRYGVKIEKVITP